MGLLEAGEEQKGTPQRIQRQSGHGEKNNLI